MTTLAIILALVIVLVIFAIAIVTPAVLALTASYAVFAVIRGFVRSIRTDAHRVADTVREFRTEDEVVNAA